MTVRRRTKTQYVEHYEEYVGEEMMPFVALRSLEVNQLEKDATNALALNITNNAQPSPDTKRKVPFWKRVAAFFS